MNYRYFLSIFKTTKIQFVTHLGVAEITERLDDLVQARTFFPLLKAFTSKKDYIGKVSAQGFEFRKLRGYSRRGINPVAYGKIFRTENHFTVDVELMADSPISYGIFLFVALFLAACLGIILLGSVVKLWTQTKAFNSEILSTLGFFWVVWTGNIYYLLYNYHSNLKAIISDLERVFEASSQPVPQGT